MERSEAERHFDEWRGKAVLWAGLLIPAFAWGIHLNLSYALVNPSCEGDRQWPFHLVSIAALAVTGFGILLAFKSWQRAGKEWPSGDDDSVLGRSRFMAVGGLLLGCLFALLIVAQYIPEFILHPCQK